MHVTTRIALLGLALSLASCGISQEQYDRDTGELKKQIATLEAAGTALEQDRKAHEDKIVKLEAELAGSQKLRKQCIAELQELAAKKGGLEGDLKAAIERLHELRAIAERRARAIAAVRASLQDLVTAGSVKVLMRDGRLIVEIGEKILFDFNRSELKPEGRAALQAVAPKLAAVERDFQVGGHTDNVGSPATNWELSLARARSVGTVLLDTGFPAERLSMAGYAFYRPVAPNDDKASRQLNRRVEIMMVPNLDELQIPADITRATPACRAWGEGLAAR